MASIEKRSDNTYRITVSDGYDRNGKKIRRHKTVKFEGSLSEKQKQKELQKQAVLFEKSVESGTYLDGEKITFEEFINKWLSDYAEKQLAPMTLYRNKLMLCKRIIPALGHIKISKLQPQHLLAFYKNLSEDGIRLDYKCTIKSYIDVDIFGDISMLAKTCDLNKRTVKNIISGGVTTIRIAENISNALGLHLKDLFEVHDSKKGLSSSTIASYHQLISAILSVAVQWQIILSNICERVKPPKIEKLEAKHYDDRQICKMFDLLRNEHLKYQVAVYIAVYGGLRLGEVTALEWSDIDFDSGFLQINKSNQYIPDKGSFDKKPKTATSNRTISIPKTVLLLLKEHKKQQIEERLKCGELWEDSNKILTQWNGKAMFHDTPSKWFNKLLKKNDLPRLKFHELRHTHATLMISQGVDIATVSKRLGHSKISVTADIYTHAIDRFDREVSDKLENLFSYDRFKAETV